MPITTETPVEGYVSCRDPRCGGYTPKPTTVLRRKQEFPYRELGGDLPGNEREAVDVVQGPETCDICHGPQVWFDIERPEYAPISGQDQLALLNLNQSGQIRDVQMENLQASKELADMRVKQAETERLLAEMAEELKRRRGGRPPKTEDDNAA